MAVLTSVLSSTSGINRCIDFVFLQCGQIDVYSIEEIVGTVDFRFADLHLPARRELKYRRIVIIYSTTLQRQPHCTICK